MAENSVPDTSAAAKMVCLKLAALLHQGFITCVSGPNSRYEVVIKFPELNQAQRLHQILVQDIPGVGKKSLADVAVSLDSEVLNSHWPDGLKPCTVYRVPCDENGRDGGCWLQLIVAEDGDVHVSMQQWESMPEGKPSTQPSIRVCTRQGGGRNPHVRQALLWLAYAMMLDVAEPV